LLRFAQAICDFAQIVGEQATGFSVFDDQGNGIYTPAQLANAISPLLQLPVPIEATELNLDAMMLNLDWIMFSIEPVAQKVDGGEIFVWDGIVGNPASFLNHGGHLWDTAFQVAATFGTGSENVNALEAVSTPEPSTLVGLLSLGGAGYGTVFLQAP
jgi:hypothetical protein